MIGESLLTRLLEKKDLWRTYESNNFTVFDFETTNLDKGFAGNKGNRIVLATWYNPSTMVSGRHGVCHRIGGEYELEQLVEAIRSSDFIVCQNGKFEMQWLSRMGVELHKLILFDTMLAEYVWAGNRRTPKDLESLAQKYGVGGKSSIVSNLIKAGVCPSQIPERWLVDYGKQDTWITYQVFLKQREILRKEGLLPVLFTRCLTTPVLADIELAGMHVCKEEVEREYKSTQSAYQDAEERVRSLAGGINFNSPKQVSAFLYDTLGFAELMHRGQPDRTDADGRRTDEDAIKALKATTPEQQAFKDAFLAAKPLVKRLDTLTKLKGCSDEDDGILLANINQAVTATHRLSSSGKKWKLQYQNIDRTLKSMFSARHSGWLIGEADGSSLEFRGAMHLGRDPVGKEDIEKGRDPHLFTATVIFKTVQEAVTSELRTAAKPYTFKPLYGGNSGTPDELRYYRAFRERYGHLYSVQTDWTYNVLLNKCLKTEWGLVFYWPDCKASGRSGYISHTTEIFNYPVQSFSTAEIIPISLFCFWHRLKEREDLKMFLVNTVHDSIVVELPPEEEEAFHTLSRQSFLEDVGKYLSNNYHITMYVPLGCEVKVGSHWSKGKGKKYEQNLLN